jgi:ADP-ribose pyrophosphatase YjhB (NUDIX family)
MSLKWRVLYLLARCYWRIFRPLTLGVKVMLIENESIWLVQHSYQSGWFLPGGGVKRNELLETAVRREAKEELGAGLGDIRLFGVYTNASQYKNDHVMVFQCHDFTVGRADKAEIRAVQQFPLRELPPDVSHGTRRRIAEYLADRFKAEVGIW